MAAISFAAGEIQETRTPKRPAAWLALDKDSDTIHLYDCAVFRREVLAVIAEGMNARGRWIPIAWNKSAGEIVGKLRDRGCNTLPSHAGDTQPAAEAASLDIWERMRSHRFKVDKRLGEWLDEFRTFYRQDSKVPIETHPLMAATRNAVMAIEYARRQSTARASKGNFPKIAII